METMKENGKHGKSRTLKRNTWVEEVMKASAKPRFNSNREALTALTTEFEVLAARLGFSSTKELWEIAEHSPEFKEEFLEALRLKRMISYFQKHQDI